MNELIEEIVNSQESNHVNLKEMRETLLYIANNSSIKKELNIV